MTHLFRLQIRPYVLISACLLGIRCRYDGRDSHNKWVDLYKDKINFIPFCPEQMGGLSTPRPPANIYGGDGMDVIMGKARVINEKGEDVTENFKKGAYISLEKAIRYNVELAIVKDKSPSCGVKTPYCEKPSKYGIGVTSALLKIYRIKLLEIGKEDILFYTGNFLLPFIQINKRG